MIYQLEDAVPQIHASAWVAENATLAGQITLQKDVSIWFNAVLRAEHAPITVGEGSNIQDGTVCHVDPGKKKTIGLT